jgi:NNP family nitrate/nitrite transporter-like MFS transporter
MDRACPNPQPFRAVAPSVAFVTLMFFVTFISRFIFSPLMPTIGHDIALTSGQAGSVFFMAAIGGMVGSLAAGFVSARIDHRGTLLTALFGTAVVLGVSLLAQSVWALRGVLLLLGFFAGLNQPSVLATITAMVRREDWGKALSVEQAAPALSLVVGPLAAVALLTVFSWRISLVCVAVFAAVVGAVFVAFRGVGAFPGDPPRLAMVRPMARGRSFWLMILLMALGMGAQVGVYTMLPLFLTAEKGMESGAANTLLGLANLSPLVMVFVAGWVSDRIGERWALLIVLLCTGGATVLLGVLDGAALTVAIFALPAFAVCFFPPAFSALARIVQPTQRSVAAALVPPTAFVLGGGLLPMALGYAGQHATFARGFVLTGLVIVLGSAGALFLVLLPDDQIEDGC